MCVCVWGGGGSIVVGATSANSGTPPLVTSGPTPHRLGQILNDDVTALGVHCACAQSALGPYPYILLLDRVFERERSGDGGGGGMDPSPSKQKHTHTHMRASEKKKEERYKSRRGQGWGWGWGGLSVDRAEQTNFEKEVKRSAVIDRRKDVCV